MRFVTTAGMKQYEAYIAASGVGYREMMERAGQSAAEIIIHRWPPKGREILILCGKGNNGGDGFVAARRLAEEGAIVTAALVCGPPATVESRSAFGDLPSAVTVLEGPPSPALLAGAELIIDAVFGTGFRGAPPDELDGLFRLVRKQVKNSGAPVVAMDIPSGVEADTGLWTSCIPADLTVAFGANKPAHLVNWAAEYAGEIVLGDIGASKETEETFSGWMECVDREWFRDNRPRRSHTAHKGENGRLLLVAGSRQFPGAAVLAAGSAVKTGVGYVRLASTSRVCKIAAEHCPEVIYTVCEKEKRGGISGEKGLPAILEAAHGSDAIAAGCGMEPGPDTLAIVRGLLQQSKPLLLDAGALTALACHPDPVSLLRNAACPVVITPHLGEYARLLGRDPRQLAEEMNNPFGSEYTIAKDAGITVLLKGPVTVVTGPDGRRRYSFGGCDGLAKGGSGDVLTGIIGGFLAQGLDPVRSALCGAWLHGEAAEKCARDWSREAMLPSQLADYMGKVFLESERDQGNDETDRRFSGGSSAGPAGGL